MRVLFAIFLFMVIITSCKKNDDDSLERINDTIVGSYGCKSATIQNYTLDLNGDGVTGNDIFAEFNGFDVANWLWGERWLWIYPVRKYGETQKINLEIPRQLVNYDKRTGKYEVDTVLGGFICIGFYYTVDESGLLVSMPEEGARDLADEDEDVIQRIDCRDNCAKEMRFDQQGGIEMLVDCTFYDFATDRLLTVPVQFIYERVSYSILPSE